MHWKAWAQLLRLPNLPTAVSDALLGTIAAQSIVSQPGSAATLIAATACLYSSGMVLNDFFDFDIDRRERPFRPLPSGRISRRAALRVGLTLMLAGVLLAALAGRQARQWRLEPFLISLTLSASILAYNGWLKNTPIGPITMGTCRLLNILLATSTNPSALAHAERIHLALVVGLYITGVTWFARREAEQSSPTWLRAAAVVILASALLGLGLAVHHSENSVPVIFPYLIVAFIFLICRPIVRAIEHPDPKNVQAAVKTCILSLIILDATLATLYIGAWGLVVVVLLAPAYYIGRFLYST